LKIGKVPPDILQKSVYPFLGTKRNEVLVHSGLGEDCSIIDFGSQVAVISCDPITGADNHSGWLSVFVSCNDIAACGAKPIGILTTVLLPQGSTQGELTAIMKGIHEAAKSIKIEVLGGHSEITAAVTKPVICTTAMGVAKKDAFVTSSGAKPGDDVIVTKAIGLEGTAILATDFENFLIDKIPESQIKTAQKFIHKISVISDGLVAAKAGVSAMHDITEGGLLGACCEIAQASGVGIKIYKESIPILPETISICEAFKINPLGLISSGSMLICTPDGNRVLSSLKSMDIPATIIGTITQKDKYIVSNGSKIPIVLPERDELYCAIEYVSKN
jgi:hydrogenase expression/formation protein HypE